MLRRLAIAALTCASLQAQAQAQAEGVVEILNRLRAPGGACAVNATPLVPTRALDEAAANVARGRSLAAALKSADYRAKEVQEIMVVGAREGARLEGFLAARFCAPLAMPQLTEAGIYAAGETVWILLAAPMVLMAPTVELSRGQVAERTLVLVNGARGQERQCGERLFASAKPVQWNELLERASQRHAADMAANSTLSHAGLDGSTPAQRVTRAGYRYRAMGENIAAGQRSPEDAVSSWIASPPHCAVLMNAAFTEMGVAYVVNPASAMGIYWTQTFGKPL